MKKKIIILGMIPVLFLMACSLDSRISLKGSETLETEVNIAFSDPGITLPKGYTYTTSGTVDAEVLGTYDLTYSIFDSEGALAKEMVRHVIVTDTTAPKVDAPVGTIPVYFGREDWGLKEELVVTDNYYSEEELTFTTNLEAVIEGYIPGSYPITIRVEDPSRNATEIQTTVEADFGFFAVLESMDEEDYPSINSIWQSDFDPEKEFTVIDQNLDELTVGELGFLNGYFYYDREGSLEIYLKIQGYYGRLDRVQVTVRFTSLQNEVTTGSILMVDLTRDFDGSQYAQLESFLDQNDLGHEYAFTYLKEHLPDAMVKFRMLVEEILGFEYR
jgi:hypothetical protein